MAALRALLLAALVLLPLAGAADTYRIPSQCDPRFLLPPMPGTPQATAQLISMVPNTTETFRVRYGTTPGTRTSYAASGSSGKSCTADARCEFSLISLTPDTRYHWVVDWLSGSRWYEDCWTGSFRTFPSTGGLVKLLIGTDSHIVNDFFNTEGEDPTKGSYAAEVLRGRAAFGLLARDRDWAHAYIDLGDNWIHHCNPAICAYDNHTDLVDDFGRPIGVNSITARADSQAEEQAFAEARLSIGLRRFWRALRFHSSIWSRGNHDVGGNFGDADDSHNSGHWQAPNRSWATTGISITLGEGNDLASNGIFSEGGHEMADGDGPYRWVQPDHTTELTAPELDSCGGTRDLLTAGAEEWYVDLVDADSFRLALTPTDAGCTTVTDYGSGVGTLVRGADMQTTVKAAAAKYLPNQNDHYPHSWGSLAEDGIMGPIPASDYVMILNLDEFDHTPETRWQPWGVAGNGRSSEEYSSWSYGTDQWAGAAALIDSLCVAESGYDDVSVLIVLQHHGLGGFGIHSAYAYARGSICETDTYCYNEPDRECVRGPGIGGDCAPGDQCPRPRCQEPYAHAGRQALHEKMVAFESRCGGIALALEGHDHVNTYGEKNGISYYHAGQLGDQGFPLWHDDADWKRRYDFDRDGVPAYWRHYGLLLPTDHNWYDFFKLVGKQNFPTEVGSEHRGDSKLTICQDCGPGGKPRIILDYIINGIPDFPDLHGTSAPGYPLTIEAP
jgi:hypothetical protein